MLLLTDIYALYNRARGTALVAPEELHTACKRSRPSTPPSFSSLDRVNDVTVCGQNRFFARQTAARHGTARLAKWSDTRLASIPPNPRIKAQQHHHANTRTRTHTA